VAFQQEQLLSGKVAKIRYSPYKLAPFALFQLYRPLCLPRSTEKGTMNFLLSFSCYYLPSSIFNIFCTRATFRCFFVCIFFSLVPRPSDFPYEYPYVLPPYPARVPKKLFKSRFDIRYLNAMQILFCTSFGFLVELGASLQGLCSVRA